MARHRRRFGRSSVTVESRSGQNRIGGKRLVATLASVSSVIPPSGSGGNNPYPVRGQTVSLGTPQLPGARMPGQPGQVAKTGAAVGQVVAMAAGCIFGFPVVVFPFACGRIRRAHLEGRYAEGRFVAGAWVSGIMTAAGAAFWSAIAVTEASTDPGLAAFFSVLAGIGVVGLLAGLGMLFTSRLGKQRPRVQAGEATARVVVDKNLFDDSELSRRVEGSMRQIASYVPVYAGYQIGGEPVPDKLTRVVSDLQELLRRLDDRGTEQQVRMAKAQYADTLDKVALTVKPDYLKDLIDHPNLWNNAEQRIVAVGSALDTVSGQILANIRATNDRTDLDFQVALASLNAITNDDEFNKLYGGTQ